MSTAARLQSSKLPQIYDIFSKIRKYLSNYFRFLLCYIINKTNDTMQTINIKRAYEPASPADGYRVYIDRLWPRGLSHDTFHYDLWEKAVAPSTELRKWFHENPSEEWAEFERRYRAELLHNPAVDDLREAIAGKPAVTLLYSSHDHQHNNAVVLRDFLSGQPTPP